MFPHKTESLRFSGLMHSSIISVGLVGLLRSVGLVTEGSNMILRSRVLTSLRPPGVDSPTVVLRKLNFKFRNLKPEALNLELSMHWLVDVGGLGRPTAR